VRAFWAQARTEALLTLRRGESLLLTLGIPVGLLVFLSLAKVLPKPSDQVGYLVPGLMALAVMSTGLVSLSIATAFEREYKVLKRLGSTPLGRSRLVLAKVASVAVVEVVQGIAIGCTGIALGWRPWAAGATGGPGAAAHAAGTGASPMLWLSALAAAVLATAGFSGLGLLMAGRLRADVVLAGANGLWLALLLLGGMLYPVSRLPSALRAVADVLPASALAGAFRATIAYHAALPAHDWLTLAAWALAAPLAAARTFRWE